MVVLYKMNIKQINHDMAYRQLLEMELYKSLNDFEIRLFLETNEYLCRTCDIQLQQEKEALYDYINEV